MLRPLTTALVLGGGGARGLAHAGTLSVLEQEGLRPDFIVGTSLGAIVGAAYALNPHADDVQQRLRGILADESLVRIERSFASLITDDPGHGWRGRLAGVIGKIRRVILWNRHAMAQSLVDALLVDELIERLVGVAEFSHTRIPFYAVAFDLNTHTDVVMGAGDLRIALRASSAIPGVFAPVACGDWLLVDGAVFQELPTRVARQLGADVVIAVDVGSSIEARPPTSAAEVLQRVLNLRGDRIRAESRAAADVVIAPAVGNVHWSEFSRAPECLAAGEAAARAQLETVRHRIAEARRRTLLRRLRSARPALHPVVVRTR